MARADKKWHLGLVVRTNAGGMLYAPVRRGDDGRLVEHSITPSHCRDTMMVFVDWLNHQEQVLEQVSSETSVQKAQP